MNPNKTLLQPIRTLLMLAATLAAGCDTDGRVARVASEAANRQAEQNQEMARLNREVAEGTRRLVENDSQARKELVTVHQDLQAERAELGEQWNSLETERKQIAHQRRTESVLVPAFKAAGIVILAALVIGFCWSLLFGLQRSEESDTELNQILIQEIVADQPKLLPPRTLPNPSAEPNRRLLPGGSDKPDPSQ